MPCTNADCMFLHESGNPDVSFTKEEMNMGKHHSKVLLPDGQACVPRARPSAGRFPR
jgi:hypothetical protein